MPSRTAVLIASPLDRELFCDNLRRDLAGEELRNRVDLELRY